MKKFITIGLLAVASLLFSISPVKATGSCSVSVVAVADSSGYPPLLYWIRHTDGTYATWTNPLVSVIVQDGDEIYLAYRTSAAVDHYWVCLQGLAYDPFTNQIETFTGSMPNWVWSGTWKVHANCATETFWLEWTYQTNLGK